MSLTKEETDRLKELLHERDVKKGKKNMFNFTKFTFDKFFPSEFHKIYYKVLDLFAKGKVLNLIITMPPQHGKSTGSTMYLPAFLFGLNPDLKIAISSYSTPITQRFNRQIQRIIDSNEYKELFPDVNLGLSSVVTVTSNPLRNASEFEIVDSNGKIRGKLMSVGRGGALTSQSVDIWIGDDLYKDYEEGNSPIVRDSVWNWYTTVPVSRQPKQKLKVFTRWHEDDSIGRIENHEKVVLVNSIEDIDNAIEKHGKDVWIKLNFEAIKITDKTEFDNREKGVALWEKERPLKNLTKIRALNPEQFQCLYQGDPRSKEGLLYGDFKTYKELPSIKIKKNYTDTADAGTDYLCSVNYGLPLDENDNNIYVLDVIYTQDNMNKAEPLTVKFLNKWNINEAMFESNNGGRYFCQNIQRNVSTVIDWFHQSKNKESRIFSNNATVTSRIVFPERWSIDYPEFYNDLTGFKKVFKANKQDGAPDVLTGIIETETNNFDDFEVGWN